MGEATGAAAIFGVTGGVMEAALRTAYELITGEELQKLEFEEIRGEKGIKKATVKIGDKDVKVAVAHGLRKCKKNYGRNKEWDSRLQFCRSNGMPRRMHHGWRTTYKNSKIRMTSRCSGKRAAAMYSIDERSTIRKSHENPVLKQIYKDYIGKPGEHKAHELLHTHYTPMEEYRI